MTKILIGDDLYYRIQKICIETNLCFHEVIQFLLDFHESDEDFTNRLLEVLKNGK